MQTNILRALALVAVGNAALGGRDAAPFAGSELHKYNKQIEFLIARAQDDYVPVAPDPVAWFAKLRELGCRGLRLHNAPMQQRPGTEPQLERMLVGMVGGGPRWLVEAVYPSRAEVWEGYDRLGDRNDPEQKIWLSAYIMIGETERQDNADRNVAGAEREVRAALTDIEALAREIDAANFAACFAAATDALDGGALAPESDFLDLTEIDPPARRLLRAVEHAWVFGAMGSWNDLGVAPALSARYDQTSEALFLALQRAVMAIANSTYRG